MPSFPAFDKVDLGGLEASARAEVRRVEAERADAVSTAKVGRDGVDSPQGASVGDGPKTDWARLGMGCVERGSDGFVALALALVRSVGPTGESLLARHGASLSEFQRRALEPPAGWRPEGMRACQVAAVVLPVARVWSGLAVNEGHPARAELLLLEAALGDAARRCRSGTGQGEPVALIWEQALAAAQVTGSLPVARLACERLTTAASLELRYDFAAYLAARLAEVAEETGEWVEAAGARLRESRFWEQRGEVEAAFEAALVALEDACEAIDRSLVTPALLATGRLACRGGGLRVAEEAFRGALGALSQGAESPAIFAHARFGLATLAAQADDWGEALGHLEGTRRHAAEAGELPLYARAVLASLDVSDRLGRSTTELLTIARRDATAAWGLGAASLFQGRARRRAARDRPQN